MMDLSVVIVSWNTRELLAQCLQSVFNSGWREIEVFVVDNASSDGSAAMVRARFPQVHLIENRENAGFAVANNQAIKQSTGKYVLLLNSDTIVRPNTLGRMVEFMNAHPLAGIVGGYILNSDETPQFCFEPFPTVASETASAWGLNSHWPFSIWFALRYGFTEEYIETDSVSGAGLMVRREALARVGDLDERYFIYSEEIDLAYRVKKAGWKNYSLGTAPIIHFGEQSTKQAPAAMKAQLLHSKLLFFQKHHGEGSVALLTFIFSASILFKRSVYSLLGKKQLAGLWAETWDYYSGRSPSGGPRWQLEHR